MPLGVNKITYNVTVTTTTYNYTQTVYEADGKTVKEEASPGTAEDNDTHFLTKT